MVRKIVYIVIILTMGSLHVSFAQDDSEENKSENHIYLNNEKSVYGDNILINPPEAEKLRSFNILALLTEGEMRFHYKDTIYDLFSYKDNYVKVNDKLYNFSDVRFIMLGSNYLAVVDDIARKNNVHLAPKTIDGDINVFTATIKKYAQELDYYFYNRGKQKPKQLRYKNIKHEFKEGTESMKYLKKHRNLKYVGTGAGIFTLTYLGINGVKYGKFLFSDPDLSEDKIDQIINPTGKNLPDVLINAAIAVFPSLIFNWFFKDKMNEYLLDSVKAYNFNNDD